jgi:hypothetical protein
MRVQDFLVMLRDRNIQVRVLQLLKLLWPAPIYRRLQSFSSTGLRTFHTFSATIRCPSAVG